jgi:hypothetical protein
MYVPYKVEPRMKAGSSSGRTMNRDPAQRRLMASFGALLQADGVYVWLVLEGRNSPVRDPGDVFVW